MITYTAFSDAIAANAAALAAAAGGTTAAQFTALAELLDILASNKSLGTPPLLKSALAKVQFNPQ